MSEEKKFHKALSSLKEFYNVDFNFLLLHPRYPTSYIEVDNIAQRGVVLFVFESKSSEMNKAILQLQERHLSLIISRDVYIKRKDFIDYVTIRLFYYSLKKRILVEVNARGEKIKAYKFNDLNQLKDILRKI